MPRLLLLAAFALSCAVSSLPAQTLQAQLEVNLGAINIDSYDGVTANSYSGVTSGPNVPSCSFTGAQSNYRTCVQYILSQYSQQGVVGVRIYFGMNGEAGSTPFLNQNGALDPSWLAKFSLLMQDLRAANLRYVALSPSWATWAPGNMSIYACISGNQGNYRYDFSCTAPNANAVFYPWLPFALTYTPPNVPANPNPYPIQGSPYDEAGPFAYNFVPQLGDINAPASAPRPWLWTSAPGSSSPLFKFWDGIFSVISNAQLQVREVDIYPEIPMYLSSLYGRLVYDNIQRVSPLDIINQILVAHQLSPTATLSTAAFQPRNNTSCTSVSGDSELVVNAYLLLSAMTTGHFGRIPFDSTGDVCGPIALNDDVYGLSTSATSIIDVHAYPADAIFDNGWGWIDNPNVSGPQRYPDGTLVTNSPLGCAGSGCYQNTSNDIDPANTDPANPSGPSGTSRNAANQIYSAVSTFVNRWQNFGQIPTPASVIIGETNQYNPGGVGRDGINFPGMAEGSDCTTYGVYGSILNDGYADPRNGVVHSVNFWCTPDWKWHRPWSTPSSAENVLGLTDPLRPTGLNRPGVVIRPWAPMSWGTVLSPAPLSGSSDRPYNVGGCGFAIGNYNQTVSGFGATLTLTVTPTLTSSCAWSIGPVTPSQPSLQTLAWPSDAAGNPIVTSASIAGGPSCVYPPASGGDACWTSGPATVTFKLAANPVTSRRSFSLNVAGATLTFTQAAADVPDGPTGLFPGNNATGVTLNPTLSWTAATGATSYLVYFQNNDPVSVFGSTYFVGMLQPHTTYTWSVASVNSTGQTRSAPTSFTTAAPVISGLEFFPVAPCRVGDTRPAAGFPSPFGAPTMSAGQTRTFPVTASACGIPANAAAFSMNFTAVPPVPGYLGLLTTYPTGQTRPNTSTLNSYTGTVVANAAIVPAGAGGSIDVYVSDKTDVLFDINGYFAPSITGLQFYAVAPCRVTDTRPIAGFPSPFGGPSMTTGQTRTFPIPSSPYGVPTSAEAYSLNVTAVPPVVPGYLGLLTTWPTGLARPNASTLNSYTGTVVANAALVPAGAGRAINVYVSDPTDVLIDVNGYFASPSASGLNFYPVAPCRVVDTRPAAAFPSPFGAPTFAAGQTRAFPIPVSSCGIPANAAAYSLNFTAVPPVNGYLGVLTTWPTGLARPNASTLNSYKGTVVANAAIVPAGSDGAINVYVSDLTDVLIDINGYFAP